MKFVAVEIPLDAWLHPRPKHMGERIVWADGSLHGLPEDDSGKVTVLRRVSRPPGAAQRARGYYPSTPHKTKPPALILGASGRERWRA